MKRWSILKYKEKNQAGTNHFVHAATKKGTGEDLNKKRGKTIRSQVPRAHIKQRPNGKKNDRKKICASKKATEITPAQRASQHREENKLRVKFGYLIIESEESQCSRYQRTMSNWA